jgi:hypothetical protein
VSLRDVGFYLRGRVNRGVTRMLNRQPPPLRPVASPEDVIDGEDSPLALSRLLIGRSNDEREAAVARFLTTRGIDFATHRFGTFEGRGENHVVEIGRGDRTVVLIAHHDAVPASPGANDNAAAVGILLHLIGRLGNTLPRGLRVRLIFSAAEEVGYLGARAYVRTESLAGVVGVLSLELCGVGDSLAVWDVPDGAAPPFLARVTTALERLGLRRDEQYHMVGRIPVFGSDHRAFAAAGIPAYGFTVVPFAQAAALREFVFQPVRSVFRQLVRRPPPFDTYHTPRDAFDTLDPVALDLVVRALEAIVTDAASG